jgi:two-component system, LytTR family, response regulator LytT
MKFLIAEDELVLAHATAEMLRNIGHTNIVLGHTLSKAKDALENEKIDVALLDINLGKGDEGLILAGICSKRNIPFIYISSYSDKGTLDKALQTQPGAYLNKPISEGTLYATLQILLNHVKQDWENTNLIFKDGVEVVKLPLKTVRYLKSENVYVNVVADSKTFLFRGSLGALMSKVPPGMLVQTHRAFAVNVKRIQRMSSTHVILNCGAEIPVSRNYKTHLPKD